MNKVKYRNWKLIHDIFINLISTEKIELKKIKLYATILINSSVECHYLDDEYLLKIEVNQLKKIVSMKDSKSNYYDDLEERIKELYNIEKNKSLKK